MKPGLACLHLFQELSTLDQYFAHPRSFCQGLGRIEPMFPARAPLRRPYKLALVRRSAQLALKSKNFLALFRKKVYILLPKLTLRGGGTFSPLRCRCSRSSWSMER